MLRFLLVTLALAVLAPPPARAASPDCAIDNARYEPIAGERDDEANYVAETVPHRAAVGNQTRFLLVMRNVATGETKRFAFFSPNGYGRLLASLEGRRKRGPGAKTDEEQGPQSTAIFFDTDLRPLPLDAPFQPGTRAPAYLILPDLGLSFWYSTLGRSFVPPQGMWRLARCAR
ncbi:MAG: hypothetical protein IPL88_02270 [Rhizobiales bacterium]|nr:hypothetical protein [Hyphomicrobiales bacterium]